MKIQGRWNKEEHDLHINILELLAIFISIRSFCKNMSNIHIKIFSDNSSAIAYLNDMGGIKSIKMNEIAKDIWSWCINYTVKRDLPVR